MRKAIIILMISCVFVFILLIGGILLYGEYKTPNEFNYVRDLIEKENYPADLKTGIKLSLDSAWLSPIKSVVHIIDTEDKIDSYFDEVSKIQVGIYKIKNTNRSSSLKIPQDVKKTLHNSGWENFISFREKNKTVECYYKSRNEEIFSIYVILLNGENLIISEIDGRLDQIIEKAIEEYDLQFKDML